MTTTPLARFAGPIAIGTAALVILTRIVQILTMPADLAGVKTYVGQTTHAVNGVASIAAFALLLVAIMAVHGRYARAAGALGAVGAVAAVIGTAFMAGDWWYEAFAVPWMADIAPGAFETGPAGRLLVGGLASFAVFAAGWALFAISSIRARVFPTAIGATLLFGGIVSGLPVAGAYLYGNVILGLGLGWLGFWIMATSASSRAESPVPA